MIDNSLLDKIIIGRVEPRIYAFTTNTIPNYLKVGDTYRPVSVRLEEWKEHFPELHKEYEGTAKIHDDVYFRDFAVHQFLETEKHRARLKNTDIPADVYYSKEFFKDATSADMAEAFEDISKDYENNTAKYQFYNAESRLAETFTYARTENYPLRPNQETTVSNFHTAVENGRTNLLMYAVMRFGKSFTSMCCAVEMDAKLVMIVSAKADVLLEWKKTVESHVKFADYDFVSSTDLIRNNHVITEKLSIDRKVVVFLTLQDLQGNAIKDKHQELFGQQIDLLLVDETHFGARAEKYGEVLKQDNSIKDVVNKKDDEDFIEVNEAEKQIKVIDRRITIHLSGTPYRILMGSEFKKEDIIAFYQFTDIVEDQEKWDDEHLLDDNYKEWDNPYYGFPQMVRFAFNPNESSRQKLKELKDKGVTYAFSALFKPKSIKKATNGSHKQFKYEQEILDLLEVIDGSKADNNLLGFLDYDRIKEGKMCRHIVIVLPYCASCDALQFLIENNRDKFRNLSDYEIINISGVDNPNAYRSPKDIKKKVADFEAEGKKTITLTVNRMLTGSTVPEWDTMLYLKDTASPQEYDQAIFRLQNQYVKKYVDDSGDTIKYNMKPQTLLVDFDPNRMFIMQEQKAQIYNVNVDDSGNTKLKERMAEELRISPIIVLNNDKIVRVDAADILTAVSNYAKDKGIKDEALEISVDLDMLRFDAFRKLIENENEIGSKSGLSTPAHKSETDEDGSNLNVPEPDENENTNTEEEQHENETEAQTSDDKRKEEISNTKRIQMYYTRILLYAFITKDKVISLSDIIESMDTIENKRIAKNLGIEKDILSLLNEQCNPWALSDLDYKIQNINGLSHSENMPADERASVAVNKFGKLGDAIVITPSNICKDMVHLLPDDFINEVAEKHGRILDIASTSGEFAVAIYNRMKSLGIDEDIIKNSIYTIPKSSICYELTRKLYDMLGLNTNNIGQQFIATDMLKIKNGDKIDYDKICKLLQQNKPFNQMKLDDDLSEGETDMIKFDAIVGNPPYQAEIERISENNGQNPRTNIFQYFQAIASKLAVNSSVLIYPGGRWIHQSGKGLKTFGYELINDVKLEKLLYYPKSKDLFASVDITDGLSIVVINKNKKSCGFIYSYFEGNESTSLSVDNPQKELLILNPKDMQIVNKIREFVKERELKFLNGSILPRSLFGIESNFVEMNKSSALPLDLNSKIDFSKKVKLLTNDKAGSAGRTKWYVVDRSCVKKGEKYISEWQVVVSSAHPGGQDGRDNQIEIIDNNSCFGRARVALKSFVTKREAENFVLYMKTDIIKYALLMTDESLSSLAKCVPDLIDYSSNNQLLKFDNTLCKKLYEKMKITPEEIAFIESSIKPME